MITTATITNGNRLLSGSWLPWLRLSLETDSCLAHDYHDYHCHWKHTLVWFMIIMATIVTGDTETFFLAHDTSNHGYYYHWRHRHLADLWLLSYHVNGETNSSEQSLALIVCIDYWWLHNRQCKKLSVTCPGTEPPPPLINIAYFPFLLMLQH